MPLEITLNANPRRFIKARSRNHFYLIEEEPNCLRLVGTTMLNFAPWIVGQECSVPHLGESLYIQTTDPDNDTIITTKIWEIEVDSLLSSVFD